MEELISLAKSYNEKLEVLAMVNGLIEESIIRKIKRHCKLHHYQGSLGNNLFTCYESLYKTKYKEYCDLLLQKENVRYCNVIHEAISWLLLPDDFENNYGDARFLPGIEKIQNNGASYLIDTVLGSVQVKKASVMFENTETSKIFTRPLEQCCYDRTYEFLELNPEYKVVFALMPCTYQGFYSHVYVTKGNIVVDITSNAYYEDASFKIPMKGKILKIASKEEIDTLFATFPEDYPLRKDLFLAMNYYYLEYKHVNQTRKRTKR